MAERVPIQKATQTDPANLTTKKCFKTTVNKSDKLTFFPPVF